MVGVHNGDKVPYSSMFNVDKDCLLYCMFMMIITITKKASTQDEVNFMRVEITKRNPNAGANRPARAKQILQKYGINITRLAGKYRNLNYVQKFPGMYLCAVTPNKHQSAQHCIFVNQSQVFDLYPRYNNIGDCGDKIYDVWSYLQ
jgi:hypothetical protein